MIIYMGISGAGKGTQCRILAKELGYTHLAMSDLIRRHADASQQQDVRKGKLVNDADAIAIVAEGLRALPNLDKVLLDGFPRTIGQAQWLVEQVRAGRYGVEAIINLELPPNKARERLQLRARGDDTPNLIQTRINWHTSSTAPAVEYLSSSGLKVYDIDASGTPQEVRDLTWHQLQKSGVVN